MTSITRRRARDEAELGGGTRGKVAAAQALFLQHAIQAPTTAHSSQLFGLQRTAGNHAVRLAVQRTSGTGGTGLVDDLKEKGADAGLGALDQAGAFKGVVAGAEGFEADGKGLKFLNPDANAAGWAKGVGGAAVGVAGVGNILGMGLDAAEVHKIRARLNGSQTLDRLEKKALERQLRIKGGDLGQRVGALGGHAADAAALGLGTGAAAAGAAGVAAPLQAFNVGRLYRKFVRQTARRERLKHLINDWNDPPAALRAHEDLVSELKKQLTAAFVAQQRAEFQGDKKAAAEAKAEVARIKPEHDKQEAELVDLKKKRADMEAAVKASASGTRTAPTLAEIAAYAELKNRRGLKKKLVEMMGGTVGVGGSIALAVAAGVGGAAIMASPVGWALAGVAAGVAIGVGIYKLVKWWRKRHSGQPNKRKAYAEHLFKLGVQLDDEGFQARRLILNLVNVKALGITGTTTDVAEPQLKTKLLAANSDPRAKKQMVAYLASKMGS